MPKKNLHPEWYPEAKVVKSNSIELINCSEKLNTKN